MSILLLVLGLAVAVGNVCVARAEEGDLTTAEIDRAYLRDLKEREDAALEFPRNWVAEKEANLQEAKTKKHLNKAVAQFAIQKAETELATAKSALALRASRVAKFKSLPVQGLQVGDVGEISASGSPAVAKVLHIISGTQMLARLESTGRIVWLVADTTNRTDGDRLELSGCYAIYGTRKHGGSTYFYLEPYTPPAERKKEQ